MNIALPALVVFLILLPGFIVRSRLKIAERTSLDYSPFGHVVTEAVLWSCLLHFVWLYVSDQWLGRELRPDVLLKLIAADASTQSQAADTLAKHWTWQASYFGSMLAFSYFVPPIVRRVVAMLRWDRIDHCLSFLLRFHGAPWYYLLTGADFAKDDEPDLIAVSAVVNVAGDAVLYTGILDDFYMDEHGKLDRLILQAVMRRSLEADKGSAEEPIDTSAARFYPIDGDYFVLRYSEAITLNVEYIKLRREAAADAVDAPEADLPAPASDAA